MSYNITLFHLDTKLPAVSFLCDLSVCIRLIHCSSLRGSKPPNVEYESNDKFRERRVESYYWNDQMKITEKQPTLKKWYNIFFFFYKKMPETV